MGAVLQADRHSSIHFREGVPVAQAPLSSQRTQSLKLPCLSPFLLGTLPQGHRSAAEGEPQ